MMELVSQLIAVFFIGVGLYFVKKSSEAITSEKTFLLIFLTYVLASMVLLYISDKLFFPNRQLLSKEAGINLFTLIKDLLNVLFGYYFAKAQKE